MDDDTAIRPEQQGQPGPIDRAADESRGQRLDIRPPGVDVEDDLMAVEVDGLALLAGAVRDGDLGGPRLAQKLTRRRPRSVSEPSRRLRDGNG